MGTERVGTDKFAGVIFAWHRFKAARGCLTQLL
jgi:hypothetical protein